MNKYIWGAIVAILIVALAYLIHFYFLLNYPLSISVDDWSGFGDYFGGILNPILSFIAVVLLIKSLDTQKKANDCLTSQLASAEKSEKLRKFENLFFNLISSQREIYNGLKLNVKIQYKEQELVAEKALFIMDSRIEYLREEGNVDSIIDYVGEVDKEDRIYSLMRAFYLIVRLITDNLSDDNSFDKAERELYFRMIINLTDFTHLRLILIGLLYLDCYPSNYLKEHNEFIVVLNELGFNIEENI